ncbi:MAG: RNA 2',3'-cyclic phosphodiesterase [Methanomicrobiales archaeon]|nr:RNA 2',3'-cyclic phosphodiesterase [Methanomicrobiales archaeon]MDD1668717.1 RNA 2',3'-cyclic phosphodiesterase [Methanomicrobiales archaeon]
MQGPQSVLAGCRARLTVVKPDSIHITLKFLGEIDEKALGRVKEALSRIRFTPFEITLGGVKGNPASFPRVIWSDVRDEGGCRNLFALVEEALAPLGIQKERRAYTPHATLARVKRFDPSLLPALKGLASEEFGSCPVACIKLKKSTLTPSGPVYEDMMEVRCA